MKKLFSLLLLPMFLSIWMISCQPDDDDDDDVVVDPREKFHGSWLATESTSMSYTVNIVADSVNQTQIKLYNFHHLGFEELVSGIVSSNTITIPGQTACQGTVAIEGTATMQSNNSTIDFYYTVNDGVNLDTIQAVYTKQTF